MYKAYLIYFFTFLCFFSNKLIAHHGPGLFDSQDIINLNNLEVVSWHYRNPHAELVVQDSNDKIWIIETESPNILRRMNILQDFFKVNSIISIHGYFHRTDKDRIKLQSVIFSDNTRKVVRRGVSDGGNTPEDLISISSEDKPSQSSSIFGTWAEGDGPDWQNLKPLDATQQQLANFDRRDDPVKRCRTPGFPRIVDQPLGMQIIEEGDQIIILYETFHAVRRIYMGDNDFVDNQIIPSRMGYSSGRWVDGKLEVKTNLLLPSLLTWDGHPMSSSAEVIEVYEVVSGNLNLSITLFDSISWEEPINRSISYTWAPKLHISDYDCDPALSRDWRIVSSLD
ncbi:MAG: DUF6152 family protein [Pseudomonadota bacterium]|nr:DUF6152 family protein [Pseudomonadota bacterium]